MRAWKAKAGGEQEASFFLLIILMLGVLLTSASFGPRSPQFCLRDLGDSAENLYVSLMHWGQNKAAGGSTDINKMLFWHD